MGYGGTSDETKNGHGGVSISLSSEDYLAQGASPKEGSPKPDQGHSKEIPEVVGMGHRLPGEARGELGEDKINDQSPDKEGSDGTE